MRLLTRSVLVLTLSLATQACGQVPAPKPVTKDGTMEERFPSEASVRRLQDDGAAMADVAVDEASTQNPAEVVTPGGYLPLPQGPAVTPEQLVEAIVRMAETFDVQEDMAPGHVAQLTALGMRPDGQGRRTGIQGPIGAAHYEFAVWKPYERHPGHTVELTVRPSESCELLFKSLNDPLLKAGFNVTKNAVGFKPTVYFGRPISSGLGLHVIISTDSHSDPQCVSRVRLEMEPSDG